MAAREGAVRLPAAAPAPARQRQRAAVRGRAVQQRRVAGGVCWIGALAVLLAGIVALNVAVLRLNVSLERLGRERTNLRAENALLSSQLSSAAAPSRIDAYARRRLRLVPASGRTYVRVPARSRPRAQAR